MIHLKLVFVYDVKEEFGFIFLWKSNYPNTTYWIIHHFLTELQHSSFISQVTIRGLSPLYPTPMVYHCANNAKSKLKSCKMFGYMIRYASPPLIVLLQKYLDYSWLFTVTQKYGKVSYNLICILIGMALTWYLTVEKNWYS